MTGSSSFGFARFSASLKAIEPAILNARSLESTSWYDPSTSSILTSATGSPAWRHAPLVSRLRAGTALVLVGLRLRLDRDRDDRVGEAHRLEHDRRAVGGEGVARRRELQADAGGDLARHDLLALLAVVRVHLEDAADPLRLAVRRVEDAVA